MKKGPILVLSAAICLLSFTFRKPKEEPAPALKTGIIKSISLLQKSSHTFLENANGCHSCHHQALGLINFSLARENGFQVNDSVVREAVDSIVFSWKNAKAVLAETDDNGAILMTGNYDLWALASLKYRPQKELQLLAYNIMQRQTAVGSWVSMSKRPPLEYYSITATALSVRNIQYFVPPVWKEEVDRSVTKAREWLIRTKPETNEERAFQLLGMKWSNMNVSEIIPFAKNLLNKQRADGGWSQLDSLSSDAYATGQSLYALYKSEVLTTGDSAFRKGIDFLLKVQHPDGSWRIQSRTYPGVPYVYSGFPYGDHQFISAAGSNWATIALLLAASQDEVGKK